MIVVLDTNVWVSGLHFAKHRGTPTLAIEKAISSDIIASCREMDAEILRVLTIKFSWSPERVRAALALPMRTVRIKLEGKVKACRDPYDDMFLECAWLAKAHFLVAGDKDLLTLGSYRSTRIMTTAQYVNGFPLPA